MIETDMVRHWEDVLTEKFGEPVDRTDEATGKNNGKQWIDKAFKVETETETSQVSITMWNKKNKEKSTMLIQCEQSKHFMNMSFVQNAIPIIYAEAMEHKKKENPQLSNKKRSNNKSVGKSPRMTRSTKKVPKEFACKVCDFKSTNLKVYNMHAKNAHVKEPVSKMLGPMMSLTKSLSQLLPKSTQVVSVTKDIINPKNCFICGKGYNKVEELSKHVEDEHSNTTLVSKKEEESAKDNTSSPQEDPKSIPPLFILIIFIQVLCFYIGRLENILGGEGGCRDWFFIRLLTRDPPSEVCSMQR